MSDIEGKAARVAASECGQRVSFNLERDEKQTPNPPPPKASAWQALTRLAVAKRRRNVQRPTSNQEIMPAEPTRRKKVAIEKGEVT